MRVVQLLVERVEVHPDKFYVCTAGLNKLVDELRVRPDPVNVRRARMTADADQIVDGRDTHRPDSPRLRKRGGRKLMVVPECAPAWVPQRVRVDSAMVKAIARARRWRRLIESGEYASITDLAAAENINQSYVCRILRLT